MGVLMKVMTQNRVQWEGFVMMVMNTVVEYLLRSLYFQVLRARGYTKLTMQIGHGMIVPPSGLIYNMQVEYFRFKDSLTDDMQRADLIISHAGAGSCLEALGARKPLLVVINEDLMSNHQMELAQQLHEEGHVHYTTCAHLEHTLQHMDIQTLKPFPTVDPYKFTDFLDSSFGFENHK
jgi:beta-1,4-N-acetylglucosaminyltransferase